MFPSQRTLSIAMLVLFAARCPGAEPASWTMKVRELNDRTVQISQGDAPVLNYNFGPVTDERVPENDPRRTRACYVHPLWGLHGEALTDDFPRDHYHHHGVFWTWPHVGIAGKHYDLWLDRGIQQRFVRWVKREGGTTAQLEVENGWFIGDEKVMAETVAIRVSPAIPESRAIDVSLTLSPLGKPISLRGAEGKSYGGLTVRFAPRSRKDSTITVPGGPAKEDLPDTPLQWADFTSRFGDRKTPSGATVMVHPKHPDYPPTWLTRYYGPLCVGWPGVKEKTLEPGKPVVLQYRIWIHNDAVDAKAIATAYKEYCREAQK